MSFVEGLLISTNPDRADLSDPQPFHAYWHARIAYAAKRNLPDKLEQNLERLVSEVDSKENSASGTDVKKTEKQIHRKIPGNLAYISNHGRIKPVLDKIISAAKPDKLTQDYLANVFNMPVGSYKSVLPILRRVGFLGPDGAPTELYTKFRSESGRPEAVYAALRNGFQELFRKSEHVYAATDAKLVDLIVETTGLQKSDPIVAATKGTFKAFSNYLPDGFTSASIGASIPEAPHERQYKENHSHENAREDLSDSIGLSYYINIVLPETKDAEVYNVIFKSLRENLLQK
jgi:hypothetical protein